jgi:hypothetical protein
MTMGTNRTYKQSDAKVTFILETLEKWQQTSGQGGVLMDGSLPFFSADGSPHQVDAGWIPEHAWSQRTLSNGQRQPCLTPSFAVKVTSADEPEFSRNHAEMVNLRDQGCQLGWLIEPTAEYVYVFQPGYPVHQIPTFDYYIDGRGVLQGFEFPLRCLRYASS